MINPAEIANIARLEEEMWWCRGMREIAWALLDPLCAKLSPRAVFEGGCGTGHFASLAARRYGVTVVAADLDAQAAGYASGREGVRSLRANLLHVPVASERFDLVLLLDALAHFRPGEDRQALREAFRTLRGGGVLLIRTAAWRVFRSRHSQFVWERQRFSGRRLRRLVAECGFTPERMTYANSLLSPIALIKFRVWEPLFQRQPASGLTRLPRPVEAAFLAALQAEAALLRAGFNLPFGQSLLLTARKT